jgi:hypothetical protein
MLVEHGRGKSPGSRHHRERAMGKALREDGRSVGVPAPSFEGYFEDDAVLDEATVEQILDTGPEMSSEVPVLEAALGIRNALIGGIVLWLVIAIAYWVLR